MRLPSKNNNVQKDAVKTKIWMLLKIKLVIIQVFIENNYNHGRAFRKDCNEEVTF